jgi:molybdenum cofactor synthesis domain-containing protein
MRVASVTLSGRVASGQEPDVRGDRIKASVESMGGKLVERVLLASELSDMKRELCRLADQGGVDLVFTSGSVGIAAHDIAGQAASEVAQFLVPGIAETMRAHSISRDPMRMLARYVAVVRGATMIITLPGAPDDLTDMLELLRPVLPGAVVDLRTRRGVS